jgi:hypothetical protein
VVKKPRASQADGVNDHSFEFREGGVERAMIFLPSAALWRARCGASDAHSAFGMGRFTAALRVLEQIGFPSEWSST